MKRDFLFMNTERFKELFKKRTFRKPRSSLESKHTTIFEQVEPLCVEDPADGAEALAWEQRCRELLSQEGFTGEDFCGFADAMIKLRGGKVMKQTPSTKTMNHVLDPSKSIVFLLSRESNDNYNYAHMRIRPIYSVWPHEEIWRINDREDFPWVDEVVAYGTDEDYPQIRAVCMVSPPAGPAHPEQPPVIYKPYPPSKHPFLYTPKLTNRTLEINFRDYSAKSIEIDITQKELQTTCAAMYEAHQRDQEGGYVSFHDHVMKAYRDSIGEAL